MGAEDGGPQPSQPRALELTPQDFAEVDLADDWRARDSHGQLPRFKSPRALSSFAGLSPARELSDDPPKHLSWTAPQDSDNSGLACGSTPSPSHESPSPLRGKHWELGESPSLRYFGASSKAEVCSVPRRHSLEGADSRTGFAADDADATLADSSWSTDVSGVLPQRPAFAGVTRPFSVPPLDLFAMGNGGTTVEPHDPASAEHDVVCDLEESSNYATQGNMLVAEGWAAGYFSPEAPALPTLCGSSKSTRAASPPPYTTSTLTPSYGARSPTQLCDMSGSSHNSISPMHLHLSPTWAATTGWSPNPPLLHGEGPEQGYAAGRVAA